MEKPRQTKCLFWLIVVAATGWLVAFVCYHYSRTIRKFKDPEFFGLEDVMLVAFLADQCTRFPAIVWCIYILAAPLREFRKASATIGPLVRYHMSWALQEGRLQLLGALLCFSAHLVAEAAFWLMTLPQCSVWRSAAGFRCAIFNIFAFGINFSLQAIGALLLSGAGSGQAEQDASALDLSDTKPQPVPEEDLADVQDASALQRLVGSLGAPKQGTSEYWAASYVSGSRPSMITSAAR